MNQPTSQHALMDTPDERCSQGRYFALGDAAMRLTPPGHPWHNPLFHFHLGTLWATPSVQGSRQLDIANRKAVESWIDAPPTCREVYEAAVRFVLAVAPKPASPVRWGPPRVSLCRCLGCRSRLN